MECKCNQPNYQECNGHQLVTKLTILNSKLIIADYCPLCKQETNVKNLSAREATETTRHASRNPNQVSNDPRPKLDHYGAFPVE